MTTLSHQPGLRPAHAAASSLAALPPTLQPHAVLSLAPPTDRTRSLAVSAAIYAILVGGVIWVAHAGVTAIQKPPINIGPVVIGDPAPPAPIQAQAHPTTPTTPVVARPVLPHDLIPLNPPPLDLTDHSGEPPAPPAQPTGTGPAGDAGTASSPVSLSGDSVRILHSVTPMYPPLAKMAHLEGQVVVRMTIDTAGIPTEVEAVSGKEVFTQPALQAARQWRFAPATQDGQPVAATFLLTLNFVLR